VTKPVRNIEPAAGEADLGRVLRLPHVRRAARHRAVQHPARRPVLVADWRKSTATTDPLGPRPAHPYRGRVQASKPTNPGQQLGPSSPLHGRGRPRLLPRVGSPSPGQPAQRQLQRRRPSRGTGSGVPAQSSAGLRRPRTALRCRCCERPWKAAWEASWSAVSGDLARIDQMEEAVRRMATEVLNGGHLDDRRALRARAGPAAKSWIAPCCWSFEGPGTSGS
jgi:hypothetical protein